MAVVILCDGCGTTVPYKDATHVMFHRMNETGGYKSATPEKHVHVCLNCYRKFMELLNTEVLISAY